MQPSPSSATSLGVTPEQQIKLDIYEATLLKWQASINLISPQTVTDVKTRHFADSIQLAKYLPESGDRLFDIGSGAGFPGMVLALLRPDLQVSLVESNTKKCSFLKHVSRETQADVTVLNKRIEDVFTSDLAVDVVTARALASLSDLFRYCLPLTESNPDMVMLFMKGAGADDELQAAWADGFAFDLKRHVSAVEPDSWILEISALRCE